MISEKRDPLERIRLATVFKITSLYWCFHSECDNPYIQISINGLVLDGTGDAVPANIENSLEPDDYEKINDFVRIYTSGSLHWLESQAFHFMEGTLFFWHPTIMCPIASEDVGEIERFSLRRSPSNCEPQKAPDHLIITTANVCRDMDNRSVVMSGSLEHIKTSFTKRGRKMATARLHDQNGNIDLIIYPNVYKNYEKTLLKEGKLTVTGRLDVSESSSYLIPESFELSER